MKKIRLTAAVVLFLISIVAPAQKQLTPQPIPKKDLKLEDFIGNPQFGAKTISFRSMNNGTTYADYSKDEANGTYDILVYDYKNGEVKDTLVKGAALKTEGMKGPLKFTDYELSSDEKFILFTSEPEQIYRHSVKANYFVYDLKNKKLTAVSDKGKQMYATFSPDAKRVAFVRDNNLFYKDLVSGNETAVTADGKRNEIINGATDWVYEEEFSFDRAYQWSPDGKRIAYYRFDETRVKEFTLTYYDGLYPREDKYKYPKAGEFNAIVRIFIYHVDSAKSLSTDIGQYEYIPRIKWTQDPNVLSVLRSNRNQNKIELLFVNASEGRSEVILKEENSSYVDVNDDLTFTEDKLHFVWTSMRDGYNHIYFYDMKGKLEQQVTKGKWDVTKLYGYNNKNRTFYYQACQASPLDRQVYAIKMNGDKNLLSKSKGWNDAEFSTGFKYYINTYSMAGEPYTCTLHDDSGEKIRVLEDNKAVKDSMGNFKISQVEFLKIKNRDAIDLNAWMIKPPGFDATKKYPVFVYVYGGPNTVDNSSQTVVNRWSGTNYFWFQMLAQKGYIIVSADNRGTPCRGRDFARAIYKQMGKLEVEDQIDVNKYLRKLAFVDSMRIGVFGWSYGGYMTSLLMTKGADYYKAGIAVAPVINWRWYDSIYTERYLQTPQENASGYDDNSPINYAKLLKGKFLLIHGTADDNVHFQNSMEFVSALVKEKKQFETFFYPNKAHGISGSRLHLYEKMTDFIGRNL